MTTKHPDLFSTVPTKEYFTTKDKRSYNRITTLLDFRTQDVAQAVGVPTQSVRYDERIPAILKERIAQWATLLNLVTDYFHGDIEKTATWFKMPNPMLGNIPPKDMILLGHYKKLIRFVVDALSENKR